MPSSPHQSPSNPGAVEDVYTALCLNEPAKGPVSREDTDTDLDDKALSTQLKNLIKPAPYLLPGSTSESADIAGHNALQKMNRNVKQTLHRNIRSKNEAILDGQKARNEHSLSGLSKNNDGGFLAVTDAIGQFVNHGPEEHRATLPIPFTRADPVTTVLLLDANMAPVDQISESVIPSDANFRVPAKLNDHICKQLPRGSHDRMSNGAGIAERIRRGEQFVLNTDAIKKSLSSPEEGPYFADMLITQPPPATIMFVHKRVSHWFTDGHAATFKKIFAWAKAENRRIHGSDDRLEEFLAELRLEPKGDSLSMSLKGAILVPSEDDWSVIRSSIEERKATQQSMQSVAEVTPEWLAMRDQMATDSVTGQGNERLEHSGCTCGDCAGTAQHP